MEGQWPENPSADVTADPNFERQMALGRAIMEKDWVVLRALALGDEHPELDVSTRLKMAEQDKREREQSGQSS